MGAGTDLLLSEFRPRSMLVTEEQQPQRPQFPIIDVHNHAWQGSSADDFLRTMDKFCVEETVILDGKPGAQVAEMWKWVGEHKDRFLIFTNLDYAEVNEPEFPERSAHLLEEAVKSGATGLKIPKSLGLGHRDKEGRLLRLDDSRFSPTWKKAGELGVPVLMHVGDPTAFFETPDGTNERYEELRQHPNWHWGREGLPSFRELLEQQHNVVSQHRGTLFIGAHVANCAEDLRYVASLLDACPNMHLDISERIPELGRQPHTAREFCIRYSDRILFGTDQPPQREHVFLTWFRLLETKDEYFPYSPDPIPRQGRWRVYGLGLPGGVLERVYSGNARRLLGVSGA